MGLAFMVEDGFGHDGTGGIASAEKENIVAHGAVARRIARDPSLCSG
jgi:hypothetical protein